MQLDIDRLFENVTVEDIQQLIAAGEGPQIEFKTNISGSLDLARNASAFANTSGGILIVGVHEPHMVVGCNTAHVSHIIDQATRRIAPVPEMRMHVVEYQEVKLAAIVFRTTRDLAVSDAGAFRRVGEQNELITAQAIKARIPPDEPPEITNQHLLTEIERLNDRLAAVQEGVNYPRTFRGRAIAFGLGFIAGLLGRMVGGMVLQADLRCACQSVTHFPGKGMSDDNRWEWLTQLDDELLQGGVMTSDIASELIRNADLCFVHDAFIGCLVMCGATIETWLREKHTPGDRFVDLIDASDFDPVMKAEMHALRKERNRWVHVDDPREDNDLEEQYSSGHPNLKAKCECALRLMRKVAYSTPFV